MREILFRGKRMDNGEWAYGFYRSNGVGNHFITQVRNDSGYYVFAEYEVVEQTVGQYTELTDKNGTKIFEGDIVGCFCNTQIFEIKWCEERGGYFLDDVISSGLCEPTPECLGNMVDTMEVIGNSHDNPELIGGDGNG